MPKISTVAQGGAQRSEQYLEARTGEGARAACPPAAAGAIMRQPSGCGFARRKSVSGATRANTASPAASERIQPTDGAASLTNSHRYERAGSSRRCGSVVQATGHERRKESAQVEARQGRRCRDRSLRRERSGRMVVPGRRIARGGRERWNQGVSDRSEWPEPESERERERRSDEPARSRWKIPASAGIGALRGVPAGMGRARRRLERGEVVATTRLFGYKFMSDGSPTYASDISVFL